jgi:hypothetical protein
MAAKYILRKVGKRAGAISNQVIKTTCTNKKVWQQKQLFPTGYSWE